MTKPHVVILGGGFAGLEAAKRLKRAPVRVTIVDRRNHHLFQPLLYQVATAGLSPGHIAEPIRSILRKQSNAHVVLGEAQSIDLDKRIVTLDDSVLKYDFLIIGTGVTHTYFGHDEWEDLAPGLKTLEDAVSIRRRFLMAFERAEREEDEAKRRHLLTTVIVGAGPTGVELAGTMAEMAHRSFPGDFRRIQSGDARIILVEAGQQVLSAYSEKSGTYARGALERRGVEVRLGQLVTQVERECVWLGEERIPCGNVFWAAGVVAGGLCRDLGVPMDRSGRLLVLPDCSLPGHPEVFAVGDLAHLVDGREALVPGVAQGALQMGTYVSRVIRRRLKGKSAPKPFVYFDKGQMATIGRASAVSETFGMRFTGLIAWLMWLFIHVVFLVGFDNRVMVMLQWIWEYITYRRGARLITVAYSGMGDPREG